MKSYVCRARQQTLPQHQGFELSVQYRYVSALLHSQFYDPFPRGVWLASLAETIGKGRNIQLWETIHHVC